MTPPSRITDNDLHAYVDGELDADARREVEAWLAGHPEDTERVAAYRRLNDELHDLFDGALDEPLPPALAAIGNAPGAVERPPVWRLAIAAGILLLIGFAGGWGLRGYQAPRPGGGPPAYVERAVGAHLVYAAEVRHPVEVGADQEVHLVKWLSKRLGHPLKAPHLGGRGFRLMGGRLLAEGPLPAAQFMYEDDRGQRITVYVRAQQGGDTAFRFVQEKGAAAFYWIDRPFAYIVTGAMGRATLLDLATAIYDDLGR